MSNDSYQLYNLIINAAVALGTFCAALTALYIARLQNKIVYEERCVVFTYISKKIGTDYLQLSQMDSDLMDIDDLFFCVDVSNIGFKSVYIESIFLKAEKKDYDRHFAINEFVNGENKIEDGSKSVFRVSIKQLFEDDGYATFYRCFLSKRSSSVIVSTTRKSFIGHCATFLTMLSRNVIREDSPAKTTIIKGKTIIPAPNKM